MIYNQRWYFRLLLVCFMGLFLSVIAVDTARGEVKNSCQNLGKVKDIDDLLFQFYSNIDSQCLFEMPVEKLEEIWDVPVVDYNNGDDWGTVVDRLKTLEQRDIFFVTKRTLRTTGGTALYIEFTNSYINKNQGYGGSFNQGQYPKLLPPPQIDPHEGPIRPPESGERAFPIPEGIVYQRKCAYYWINKAQSDEQPLLFFLTDFFKDPVIIAFYNKAMVLRFGNIY